MVYVRKKKYCLIMVIISLSFLSATILFRVPNFLAEHLSISHLAEHEIRVKYLNSMHQLREESITALLNYFVKLTGLAFTKSAQNYQNNSKSLLSTINLLNNNDSIFNVLSTEASIIFKISTSFKYKFPSTLQLPRVNFLSQLLKDSMSLQLSYILSKHRTGFAIVLGIPTVKRNEIQYLMITLENIIANMNNEEKQKTLIVIYIGETDMDFIKSTAEKIQNHFFKFVVEGLIDIIAPLPSYYPNYSKLRITLNDKIERVKWRSKENLDVSFLMAYARLKGKFYVHLEDDIVMGPGYINIMEKFAIEMSSIKNNSWFMLDFCQLGFIGKMFKSQELPWLIIYLQIFYNEKPIDWLIGDIIEIKTCNFTDTVWCTSTAQWDTWVSHNTSIFRHIGAMSSLKNKMTLHKDRNFIRSQKNY